jgi:tetratricopeptide (TPR) repeat protein
MRALARILIVAGLAATPAAASAQILVRTEHGIELAVLYKQANELFQRERYLEAAEIYLTIVRVGEAEQSALTCDALYNAGICLHGARLPGAALAALKRLTTSYPRCEHAARAHLRAAQIYDSLIMLDEAVHHYLEYALRYPAETEAIDALENATVMLIILRRDDEALDAARRFERNYARRHPGRTASLMFAIGRVHVDDGNWGSVRAHYKLFLKRYAAGATPAEKIQAHAFLGEAARQQDQTKQALKHYRTAVRVYEAAMQQPTFAAFQHAPTLEAVARAKYEIAMERYRVYAGLALPVFKPKKKLPKKVERWWKKLRGGAGPIVCRGGECHGPGPHGETWSYTQIQHEHWTQHRFKPWLGDKLRALDEVRRAVGEVLTLAIPSWGVAAAARLGDVHLDLVTAFGSVPVPAAIADDPDLKRVFDEALGDQTAPVLEQARLAYEQCLEISVAARAFTDDARHCEQRLSEQWPKEYPLAAEIMPSADLDGPPLTAPGPILERKSKAEREREEARRAYAPKIVESLDPLVGL